MTDKACRYETPCIRLSVWMLVGDPMRQAEYSVCQRKNEFLAALCGTNHLSVGHFKRYRN